MEEQAVIDSAPRIRVQVEEVCVVGVGGIVSMGDPGAGPISKDARSHRNSFSIELNPC